MSALCVGLQGLCGWCKKRTQVQVHTKALKNALSQKSQFRKRLVLFFYPKYISKEVNPRSIKILDEHHGLLSTMTISDVNNSLIQLIDEAEKHAEASKQNQRLIPGRSLDSWQVVEGILFLILKRVGSLARPLSLHALSIP